MLDGHRTAQDVVDRAGRIGLPLDLHSLEDFIDFLGSHGLIARTEGEAASSLSPWAERIEWDPMVRMQFQSTLKAMRAGKLDEARVLLDRLLASAPLLDEARALRGSLVQYPASDDDPETFNDSFQRAQRGWLARPARVARLSAVPARADGLDENELAAVRPSFAPMAALIAIIAAAAVALLIPFPARVSAPAELSPVSANSVTATTSGVVGDVRVHEGQSVGAREPLVTFVQPAGETLSAPSSGTVSDLTAVSGQRVVEGQRLMEIDDTRQLRMTARLDPQQARDVRPGQTATIALGRRNAKATISAVRGHEAEATLDNAGQALEPGHAVVDIDIGSRSLLQRLR
jgi:biotin carboxyl carrier protein